MRRNRNRYRNPAREYARAILETALALGFAVLLFLAGLHIDAEIDRQLPPTVAAVQRR